MLLVTGDQKAHVRSTFVNAGRCPQQCGKVALDLLSARARQEADDVTAKRPLLLEKVLVQPLLRQLIEKRMADILGRDATFPIPLHFERKAAQDVIDPAAHLVHTPTGP